MISLLHVNIILRLKIFICEGTEFIYFFISLCLFLISTIFVALDYIITSSLVAIAVEFILPFLTELLVY